LDGVFYGSDSSEHAEDGEGFRGPGKRVAAAPTEAVAASAAAVAAAAALGEAASLGLTLALARVAEAVGTRAAEALPTALATAVTTTMAVAEYIPWAGKRRREHRSTDTTSDGGSSTVLATWRGQLQRTTANSPPEPVGREARHLPGYKTEAKANGLEGHGPVCHKSPPRN